MPSQTYEMKHWSKCSKMFVAKSFKSYPVLRDAGRLISTEETILVDVVNLFFINYDHQVMTFLNVPFKIGILSLPPSLKIMIKTCSMLSAESPHNHGDDNPQDHCDHQT